ncbi:MAG: sugar ABC transporter substrate-binding protein [Spirochaetota bacterium]
MQLRNWKKTLFMATACMFVLSMASMAQKAPVNAKGKPLSIASVDFPQFQPYKVRTESEKKACDDYGIKYTLFQPPAVTTESYLETIANVLQQGFDAVIVEPWDYEAFVPVLETAKKMGIPMVSVHQKYPKAGYFISMLYIDNEGYGVAAADALGKSLNGKANVLFLMNDASIPNQVIMRQSFINATAKKWPGIKVVDTEYTKNDGITASKVLEAAFKAYPEIDTAIWLEGATVTVGVDVVKEMGLVSKVKVVGIDDPPDVIAAIGRGEAWGSFNQNFQKQGYEAVRNIADYFNKAPFPKETDCGIVLITKANWNNYIPSMWAPVAVKGKAYPK